MSFSLPTRRRSPSLIPSCAAALAVIVFAGACAPSTYQPQTSASPKGNLSVLPPTPDPRVGLRGGAYDAAEAVWNLRVLSETRPSEKFAGGINSDLAFIGNYVFQGSFSGYQVWDISNPRQPVLKTAYVCPASQSDVSVYRNLLFVSGEDLGARLDCGTQGVKDTVSAIAERAGGMREPFSGKGPELGAVPHRSDQGATGSSRAGGDRHFAADIHRTHETGQPR